MLQQFFLKFPIDNKKSFFSSFSGQLDGTSICRFCISVAVGLVFMCLLFTSRLNVLTIQLSFMLTQQHYQLFDSKKLVRTLQLT